MSDMEAVWASPHTAAEQFVFERCREMEAEVERLKAENETLRYCVTVLSDIAGERDIEEFRVRLAVAVAEAGAGWQITERLKMRFIMASAEPNSDPGADVAYRLMVPVCFEARNAYADALHEYRAAKDDIVAAYCGRGA